jgi:hypothetical protein
MGAKYSGPGIELRKGVRSETIRIVFWHHGKRCRESLPLAHTKANIAYARRLQGEVTNAIERGTFSYQAFFPNSTTAKKERAVQDAMSALYTPKAVTVGGLIRDSLYIALHWRDVSEALHQISVTGSFVDGQQKQRAKTDAGLRSIDLRAGALAALQSQRPHTGHANELVFLNPRTREQWAGDKPIYRRWRRILKQADVRYRNPYQTRHTFASTLLMLGAVPLYVAGQMGHTDTTMITRNYGKRIKAGLDGNRRTRLLVLYQQTDPKRTNEFPNFA